MSKVPTDFDQLTDGGLPRGRTTLVGGGPGPRARPFLPAIPGARRRGGQGTRHFCRVRGAVARISSNARSFGWNLDELQRGQTLYLLGAQPMPDVVQSGDFDLEGLLAGLWASAREMGAQRIVFDARHIVLALLPDPAARRRQVYRLHAWLLARELTGLITAKGGADGARSLNGESFGFMQFMVDCGAILSQNVTQGVSQRNVRVQKYRGSSFDENESPFLIGNELTHGDPVGKHGCLRNRPACPHSRSHAPTAIVHDQAEMPSTMAEIRRQFNREPL